MSSSTDPRPVGEGGWTDAGPPSSGCRKIHFLSWQKCNALREQVLGMESMGSDPWRGGGFGEIKQYVLGKRE